MPAARACRSRAASRAPGPWIRSWPWAWRKASRRRSARSTPSSLKKSQHDHDDQGGDAYPASCARQELDLAATGHGPTPDERSAGSAGERLEVACRDRDLGERVVRVVLLHDVPLHASRTAGLDDLREGQDPLPRRGVPGFGTGGPILHVEQAHAIGDGADLANGISPPNRGPVDVSY